MAASSSSSSSSSASRKPRVNLKDLKKLIDMMRKAELSEVNIEQEGIKIALKKSADPQIVHTAFAPAAYAPAPQVAPVPAPAAAGSGTAAAAVAAASAPQDDANLIKSPMVGTFYRSSSPDAEAYAKEGMRVEVGQTVCIIEAMKLMNEIKAEAAGTITKILIENAQPVEFGQPLFSIKP